MIDGEKRLGVVADAVTDALERNDEIASWFTMAGDQLTLERHGTRLCLVLTPKGGEAHAVELSGGVLETVAVCAVDGLRAEYRNPKGARTPWVRRDEQLRQALRLIREATEQPEAEESF